MPNNYVGQGFFAKLVDHMKAMGYKFITQVQISDQDVRYHVQARTARVTSLFFKVRMRQFIVQLTLNEWINPEGELFQWWRMDFHFKLKPTHELLDITRQRLVDKYDYTVFYDSDEWREYERGIPFVGPVQDDLIENFRYFSDGTFEQIDSNTKWETPMSLADKVDSVWNKVSDYIGEFGRIAEYQVTTIPPHYTFPGSEPLFWERFGQDNLHKLFKKAWGSDFPPSFNCTSHHRSAAVAAK